jgi:hypothetical protein
MIKGLTIVDLEEILVALLSKRVVMIFELMLQYQIVTIIQDMQSPTFKT